MAHWKWRLKEKGAQGTKGHLSMKDRCISLWQIVRKLFRKKVLKKSIFLVACTTTVVMFESSFIFLLFLCEDLTCNAFFVRFSFAAAVQTICVLHMSQKINGCLPSDSCLTARPFVTANRACFCDKCDTIASRYGYWYSTASRRRADTPSDWYTSLLRRRSRSEKCLGWAQKFPSSCFWDCCFGEIKREPNSGS